MFVEIASEDLEYLIEEVESGELRLPLSSMSLAKLGLGSLVAEVALLRTLDRDALLFVVRAVLAERVGRGRPPELVWTGPEGRLASARSTEVVFRELLASARKSVWMAGYAVDHGIDLFAPLHQVMVDYDVQARFLLNLESEVKHEADIENKARFFTNQFLRENWPFEGPRPAFYYDPRSLQAKVYASMHAKTLVIDEQRVLIGSANFTNRGQTRNIEAGALLHDPRFARSLVTQFQSLIDGGFIRPSR